MSSSEDLTYLFSYFSMIFRQLSLLGHLDLLRPNVFGENKKTKTRRSGLGMDIYNTRAKFQGISLRSGVDIWTFLWKKCVKFA